MTYQQKPSSELGTSFPSNAGQNGHEMLTKVWPDLFMTRGGHVNYTLALTKSIVNDWKAKAFAICLYGDWTPCCYSCWPSTIPEGVQGGVRHSVFQGIWWDRYLDSWIFLRTDCMISMVVSPCIYKSSKSLHGDIRFSWLTKNICKMSSSWYWTPPSPKPYNINFSPLLLWSSLSELSEMLPPGL